MSSETQEPRIGQVQLKLEQWQEKSGTERPQQMRKTRIAAHVGQHWQSEIVFAQLTGPDSLNQLALWSGIETGWPTGCEKWGNAGLFRVELYRSFESVRLQDDEAYRRFRFGKSVQHPDDEHGYAKLDARPGRGFSIYALRFLAPHVI